MGFHCHHFQHIKLYADTWNTLICQWKSVEVVEFIMPAVRLFVVDILVAELKNYNIHIAGIQETKWNNRV